ncbi:arginase [Botrytis cinerea]
MLTNILTVAALCASALAHAEHEHQVPIAGPHKSLWYNTLPGDGGTQADSVFSGISTFGRLPYSPCLATDDVNGGYNVPLATNPFDSWATVIDCGDIPVTSDYENDGYCGFEIVEAREIDTIGMDGIIKKIRERVGLENPVYLSIDIDTLDPAFAPATGTPETGGWSTRELRTILRGLEGINLIAADIVEVAPAYDTNAEHTTMAAADALYEVLSLMVKKGH